MNTKRYIGCSGFAQGYWKGVFYPEDLPSKEYLKFYAEHLKAVEINSTFYRRPTLKTLEKWYAATGADFIFFIKIPKPITHLKKLQETKEDTTAFCNHIKDGLKEKLAGFLFQLPPSFHFSEENLELLIATVQRDHLNVVEFRDKSWWQEDVLEKLKIHNIVFCGVSFPKDIPDKVMTNNQDFLYYRFHGVPVLFKSEYTPEELKARADAIDEFPGTAFVFFNNTWGTAGIKNALLMQNIL